MHKGEYPIGANDPTFNNPPDARKPTGIFDYNCNAIDLLREPDMIGVDAGDFRFATTASCKR